MKRCLVCSSPIRPVTLLHGRLLGRSRKRRDDFSPFCVLHVLMAEGGSRRDFLSDLSKLEGSRIFGFVARNHHS